MPQENIIVTVILGAFLIGLALFYKLIAFSVKKAWISLFEENLKVNPGWIILGLFVVLCMFPKTMITGLCLLGLFLVFVHKAELIEAYQTNSFTGVFKIVFAPLNENEINLSKFNRLAEKEEQEKINPHNKKIWQNHKDKDLFFGNLKNLILDQPEFKLIMLKKTITTYIKYVANEEGQPSYRKIDVYGLSTYYGDLYLSAFCHLKGERRTFKMDRVEYLINYADKQPYDKENISVYIQQEIVPLIYKPQEQIEINDMLEKEVPPVSSYKNIAIIK